MAITADLLPTFPRIFFLYLEPVAITYGMFMNHVASEPLYSMNPSFALPTVFLGPTALMFLFITMLYGLAILLSSPPNKLLLQMHIWILIIADFIHWGGLVYTMTKTDPRGFEGVLDTTKWSPEVWSLAVYPIGTLLIKFGTLSEVFGRVGEGKVVRK